MGAIVTIQFFGFQHVMLSWIDNHININTDTGYVNADEYEKTESDLIQKNEEDEDSSYITKASEQQQGIENKAEQDKEINDISTLKLLQKFRMI